MYRCVIYYTKCNGKLGLGFYLKLNSMMPGSVVSTVKKFFAKIFFNGT